MITGTKKKKLQNSSKKDQIIQTIYTEGFYQDNPEAPLTLSVEN
jgi:hypothetical protein